MALYCTCPDWFDDPNWYFWEPNDYTTLKTERSRRCRSCNELIRPGNVCIAFERWRGPRSDVEEWIKGDEIPLATWYMCERCADIFFSLKELGFCPMPGDDMRELLEEYHEEYGRVHKRVDGEPA